MSKISKSVLRARLKQERLSRIRAEQLCSELSCHILNDLVTYAELSNETERAEKAEQQLETLRESCKLALREVYSDSFVNKILYR